MSETLTQRLLAAVFDDKASGDDLVRDLALSADAHGELVRLAVVLARLPGHGARAAERRLDDLLDEVSLVAASESRMLSGGTDAMRGLALTGPARMPTSSQTLSCALDPLEESSVGVPNDPTFGVAAPGEPRARARIRKGLLLTGVAVAAAVAISIAWSSREAEMTASRFGSDSLPMIVQLAPTPAPAPPAPGVIQRAFVKVNIRVHPETAEISIDGKAVDGNPFSGEYLSDGVVHLVGATAAGYSAKQVAVVFDTSVMLDMSLERSEPRGGLVEMTPPAPRATTRSASPAITSPGAPPTPAVEQLPRDVVPAAEAPGSQRRALDAVQNADVLYTLGQRYHELHNYAAALSTFERWLAEAGATAPHRREVEQTIAKLQLRVGKITITMNAPGYEITVDDVFVGRTPLREPILVNVGRRKITLLHASAAPATRFVDVAAHSVPLELSFNAADTAIDTAGGSRRVRAIDPSNPYGGAP